jgi:hypothetical protein
MWINRHLKLKCHKNSEQSFFEFYNTVIQKAKANKNASFQLFLQFILFNITKI